VSDISLVTKESGDKLLAYVVRPDTGLPVRGTEIRVLTGTKILASGTTAADGLWTGRLKGASSEGEDEEGSAEGDVEQGLPSVEELLEGPLPRSDRGGLEVTSFEGERWSRRQIDDRKIRRRLIRLGRSTRRDENPEREGKASRQNPSLRDDHSRSSFLVRMARGPVPLRSAARYRHGRIVSVMVSTTARGVYP
jgi:hypothetical protein